MIYTIGILIGIAYIVYFFWLSKNDPEKADKELDEWNKARTLRRIRELEQKERENDGK